MRFAARSRRRHAARTAGRSATPRRRRGELSPVETVVAALAACTAMDVVSIALKKRQAFTRYEVQVEADQRDEYPQVLTRVDVVHEVEGPAVSVAAIRRCIELSATKYCPVNAMLSAGATEVHHRYRMIGTGPRAVRRVGRGHRHRPVPPPGVADRRLIATPRVGTRSTRQRGDRRLHDYASCVYSHASMTAIHPDPARDGRPRAAERAREREPRGGDRGGSPAWRRRADPGRDRRCDRLRRRRARPAPRPPPGRRDRRARRARPRRRADRRRSTLTSPRPPHLVDADLPDRRRGLPRPPPRHGGRARPGDRRRRRDASIDLGPGLPAARPGRLPALVRLRAPPPRAPRGRRLRPARAPPRRARALARRAGPDRRRAGLLPDRHAPRARAAGPGRADRRPRRRRQERRLGRRPRAEGGAPLRRGQRERQGLRRRRPPPRRRDRAGARRARVAGRRWRPARTRARRGRLPAPPRPDEPRDPVDLPRPADAGRSTRPSSTRCTPPPTPTSRSSTSSARRRPPSTSTAATSPGSTSGSTSGPAGSSRSASSTTSSRAPPARRSRRSTSSTACPRRSASSSSRSRHDRDRLVRRPDRTDRARTAPRSTLPPVERRAGRSRPGSSPARSPPGSRPPAGRTWPIVVADRRPGRGGRGVHPERVRRGAGPAVAGAPRGDASRPAAAGPAGRRAIVSTSGCANAATGPAGDADQARGRRGRSPRRSASRPSATLLLSTGLIGTRLPLDKVAAGHRTRSSATASAATDAALEAAAVALRTTDSRTKLATVDARPARTRRTAGRGPGHRDRQGRRDDPPADGDDARGRPDRRDGRAGGPPRAAPPGRGPDLGPAQRRRRHEHERHGLPPRLRAPPGRRRSTAGTRAAAEPRRRASRRSPATSPASRRPTARAPRRC